MRRPHSWRLFVLVIIAFVSVFIYGSRRPSIREEVDDPVVQDVPWSPVLPRYNWAFSQYFPINYITPSTAQNERMRGSEIREMWRQADSLISKDGLYRGDEVDRGVLEVLSTAPIIYVDFVDVGDFESGTGVKWIAVLEGGQKVAVKLMWEPKGQMKPSGLCNYGFEMPWAEVAAFHLHKILGFYNTPYVTGRRINLLTEVLPNASPAVAKTIEVKGGGACVVAKCHFCDSVQRLCTADGMVAASFAYWIPRKLKLYTWYPRYMPWSTPRREEWEGVASNNHSYCDKVRQEDPYNDEEYFLDLMDFAILDSLMYNFDSKHYVIDDASSAKGLTVRLDHGRAFCNSQKDDLSIFLAPLAQCCVLRRRTYNHLTRYHRPALLTQLLKRHLATDPLSPGLMASEWFAVLERRLSAIMKTIDNCATLNEGLDNILR